MRISGRQLPGTVRRPGRRRSGAFLRAVYLNGFAKAVAITAPTGIAACNVGGTTLNSFAGVGLGKETAEVLASLVRRRRFARRSLSRAWLLCRRRRLRRRRRCSRRLRRPRCPRQLRRPRRSRCHPAGSPAVVFLSEADHRGRS